MNTLTAKHYGTVAIRATRTIIRRCSFCPQRAKFRRMQTVTVNGHKRLRVLNTCQECEMEHVKKRSYVLLAAMYHARCKCPCPNHRFHVARLKWFFEMTPEKIR